MAKSKNKLVITKKSLKAKTKNNTKSIIPGEFRLSARSLCLTYSDVNVDLSKYQEKELQELILKQLQTKPLKIKDYVIGLEYHQNGVPHFHVVLTLSEKCDIQSPRTLDLEIEGKVFHGKYEATRTKKNALDYAVKGGNFLTNLTIETHEGKIVTPEEKAFYNCMTVGQRNALKAYVTKYPERAMKKLSSLKATLKNLEWVLEPEEEFIEPEFTLKTLRYKNLGMKAKILFLAENKLFNRTPILYGPGNTGKSIVMRALMKALNGKKLLIRNKEQAANLREEHDVLGYDEFKLKDFDNEDFINLLDQDETSAIRVLFDIKKKKKGLAVILGTNKIKEILKKEEHLEAIFRRAIFIKVDRTNSVRPPKKNVIVDVDFGDDFKIEEHIENIEDYTKYHHYSLHHPLTKENYKVFGLEPPVESDDEEYK